MMKKYISTALLSAGLMVSVNTQAMDPSLLAKLEAASHGDHRSDRNKARNQYRNPISTLAFFGLEPGMTVLEIAPGGGWYTEVIAPAMHSTGQYIAGSYDVSIEGQPKYRYRQHQALLDNIKTKPDLYGKIEVASYSPPTSRELWTANSIDMVLTFRSSHGWTREGMIDDVYSDFFKVVKPGGVLGVVQHRAPENDDAVTWAKKGYVSEARIIAAANKAGFILDAKSEINANPADTKDHSEGVWTLPPVLALKDQEREKYMTIGESDRMTLRFKKPTQ